MMSKRNRLVIARMHWVLKNILFQSDILVIQRSLFQSDLLAHRTREVVDKIHYLSMMRGRAAGRAAISPQREEGAVVATRKAVAAVPIYR